MSDADARPRLRGLYRLLPDHTVVAEEDVQRWAQAQGETTRRVARTRVGDLDVSTIFLGFDTGPWCFLDEDRDPPPPPLGCFETMVFRAGSPTGRSARYGSWVEAVRGHDEIVAALRQLAPE